MKILGFIAVCWLLVMLFVFGHRGIKLLFSRFQRWRLSSGVTLDPEVFRVAAQEERLKFSGCCIQIGAHVTRDGYVQHRDFLDELMEDEDHRGITFWWPAALRNGPDDCHTSETPRIIALELAALMVEDAKETRDKRIASLVVIALTLNAILILLP